MRHCFSPEQIEYLRTQYRLLDLRDLVAAFNDHFGLDLALTQIRSAIHNRRMQSGRTGRFEKGLIPWNTGKRGYMGANRTSFKPGQIPANKKPLWTERFDKNGYIEMSVPERNPYTGFPTRYKHKHVWIWEQEHGPKPKGTAVIFLDGDNRNFDPANLQLVSRKELLVLNLHGYKDQPAELKPSVMAIARLEAKAGVRTRPGRGRNLR